MKSFFFIAFAVLLLSLTAISLRLRSTTVERIAAWARQQGYKMLSCEVLRYAHRRNGQRLSGLAHVQLTRIIDGTQFSGTVTWEHGIINLKEFAFIPESQRALTRDHTDEVAGIDVHVAGDATEANVLSEINRRLDQITSQPNWSAAYDLDHSGHIDEEEWSILRNQVSEQVRAELGEPGVQAVLMPAGDGTTSVDSAANTAQAPPTVAPQPSPAPSNTLADKRPLDEEDKSSLDESPNDVLW